MENIRIKDTNIAHDKSSSPGKYPSYFRWLRDDDPADTNTVVTDSELTNHFNTKPIAWILEPPAISSHIYKYVDKNAEKFKYILTYSQELIDRHENAIFYPHGGTRLLEDEYNIYTEFKDKFCSIVVSDKQWTEGHKFRHKCKEISTSYPVDIFEPKDGIYASKVEAGQSYYYNIVVENGIYDDYFTEKIIDSFLTGCIPIYNGTKNLKKYFNMDGVIEFNSADELERILDNLSRNYAAEYKSKQAAIEENFEIAKKYAIAEDWIFKNKHYIFK